MKLKGLHFADVSEIQDAVTDELKTVQKDEFSAAFQNCTTAQKPVYMPMGIILNKKRFVSSCSGFDLKKISPTTFGPHCVSRRLPKFLRAGRKKIYRFENVVDSCSSLLPFVDN